MASEEALQRRWARRVFSLADFERLARRRLPAALYGFAANGSEDSQSVKANRNAFEDLFLEPVGLLDVSSIDATVRLFGKTWRAPVGVAPMGGLGLFKHEADLELARGAHSADIPFVLSAASSVPLEQMAEQMPDLWYQAYMPGDVSRIDRLLARLRAACIGVLVLTVDVPVSSNRDADRRRGFEVPVRPTLRLAADGLMHPRWLVGELARTLWLGGVPRLCNMAGEGRGNSMFAAPTPQMRAGRDRFTWEHVEHIRRHWQGPLLLKGVLSPRMVERAAGLGLDGAIVSNHGGRQLDGAVASLHALERIRETVPAGFTLCLDGGVRRGSDVVKALALGAAMVFIGRPFLYAAAVGGAPAVRHAAQLLQDELRKTLALLGCTAASDCASAVTVLNRVGRPRS